MDIILFIIAMKNINKNLFKISLAFILSILGVNYLAKSVSAVSIFGTDVNDKITNVKGLFDSATYNTTEEEFCLVELTKENGGTITLKAGEYKDKNNCNYLAGEVIRTLKAKNLYEPPVSNPSNATPDETGGAGSSGGSSSDPGSYNSSSSTGKTCGGTNTALIECDDSGNGLVSLIKMVVKILYTLVGIVAVVMIMAAGVVYATAGENANQVSMAKTMIRNTAIGILLYVFMTVILNFLVPGGVF